MDCQRALPDGILSYQLFERVQFNYAISRFCWTVFAGSERTSNVEWIASPTGGRMWLYISQTSQKSRYINTWCVFIRRKPPVDTLHQNEIQIARRIYGSKTIRTVTGKTYYSKDVVLPKIVIRVIVRKTIIRILCVRYGGYRWRLAAATDSCCNSI